MEERREVRSLMVVLMVLGLLVGHCSSSTFSDCYKGCFLICVITPGNSLFSCGTKCLKDCILPFSISSLDDNQQTHYFCKYGCASSLCTHLSSKQDPGEMKVARCVNSCSGRCIKNYRP